MATEKIHTNPFKRGSAAHRFFEMCGFTPEDGHSRIVPLQELEENGLGFGNGGGWCRNDGALGEKFNIYRKKQGGKIVAVQLTGYKVNHFNKVIDPKIVAEYKDYPCCVLATRKKTEIDHKDGRKIDYKLHENQTIDDFQPMSKPANDAKRSHCKRCTETGKRFDARTLGYSVAQIKGPEDYVGTCIGCYWYDPKAFNKAVSTTDFTS